MFAHCSLSHDMPIKNEAERRDEAVFPRLVNLNQFGYDLINVVRRVKVHVRKSFDDVTKRGWRREHGEKFLVATLAQNDKL